MEALLAFVPPHLPLAIGWAILHSVWQIAFVALAVAVFLHGLRPANPEVRYAVAGLGLILAAAVPVASVVDAVSRGPTKSFAAERSMVLMFTSASDEPVEVFRRAASSAKVERAFVLTEGLEDAWSATAAPLMRGAFDGDRVRRFVQPMLPWLFLLWIVGVVLRGSTVVMGAVGLMRLKQQVVPKRGPWVAVMERLTERLGVRQPVVLVESMTAEVPFVVGWLRPMIVVPSSAFAGIPPAHLESIIAHELAHVRRHDYIVNLLQIALETLFFYHPGVWWLSAQIRAEREHCCDDLAANACYGPLSYARALVQLEELRALPPIYAPAATDGSLLDRVARLTASSSDRGRRGTAGATVVVVLLAVALPLAAWYSAYANVPSPSPASEPLAQAAPAAKPDPAPAAKPDPAPQASRADSSPLTQRQRDHLRRLGVDARDIEDYAKVGYSDYKTLRRFAAMGIDARDAAVYQKAGFRSGKVIVKLARHGLDANDIESFKSVGLDLSENLLLQFARYGVDAEDAKALLDLLATASGVDAPKNGDAERRRLSKILLLARLGVDADDIRAYRKSGLKLSVDDIRRLARLGIDGADLTDIRMLGLKLSIDEVVELRRHGVDAEDIIEFRRADVPELSTRQIIDLARHGVDAEDMLAFQAAGIPNLTFRQVRDLARHGIDPDEVRAYLKLNLSGTTVRAIIDMARHGIDPEDVTRAQKDGRAKSVDELIDLARHGEL